MDIVSVRSKVQLVVGFEEFEVELINIFSYMFYIYKYIRGLRFSWILSSVVLSSVVLSVQYMKTGKWLREMGFRGDEDIGSAQRYTLETVNAS